MLNGDAFELIDGENLEFKDVLIKEVVARTSADKVIVVAVIGPQSTGKSTLMNYAFGAQFGGPVSTLNSDVIAWLGWRETF